MALALLAIAKHDCPVCDQVLPALDAAGARLVCQATETQTAEQVARLSLTRTPELDPELALSDQLDPDAVPALFLPDGGDQRDRVIGLDRERMIALASAAGIALALDGLPALRPGCGSRTRDPEVAGGLAGGRARGTGRDGRIRARELELGDFKDPVEALHDRGVTDGLPVVPPTPERVVAMLEHTSRDSQDVVPPYGGVAAVEKVAINAKTQHHRWLCDSVATLLPPAGSGSDGRDPACGLLRSTRRLMTTRPEPRTAQKRKSCGFTDR